MTATTDARTQFKLDGVVLEGDILIRIKDANGDYGKTIGPISPVKLALNSGDQTTLERKLKLRGMWGQVTNSVVTDSGSPTVSFETDDSGSELILPALRATEETVSEAGGSVSDGVTAVPNLGDWLKLPHRNIATSGFSGKKANDAPLVAGTDYVIQDIWLQHGRVWIPAGSAIAAAESCKWTYTYGAVSGSRVLGNTLSQVEMQIELFGINKAAAAGMPKDLYLLIHAATVSKGTDLDFTAAEYFKPNFSGTMVTPSGESSPYHVEFLSFA